MLAKNTIGINSFFMINKKIALDLGFEAAMFLAVLADAEQIFSDDDVNAGYVFQTIPTVQSLSMGVLTRRRQDIGIAALIDAKIVEQKNFGLPMKRYFRINNKVLAEYLSG